MATSIHPSIPVLSPSFLYHPYIPSLESKDFSFTCILSTTVLSDTGAFQLEPEPQQQPNMHMECALSPHHKSRVSRKASVEHLP